MKQLLFTLCAVALSMTTLLAQQDGYEIKVKINKFEGNELVFGYFFGDKQYVNDTTTINDKGEFVFKGEEALESGVYLLILPPDNQFFQVLVDKDQQHFSLETTKDKLTQNIKVSGSPDNARLYGYLAFLNAQRKPSEELSKELKKAEEAGKPTDKIEEKLQKINDDVAEYQRKFITDQPNALSSALIRANIPLPGEPKFEGEDDKAIQLKRYYWTKKHFFDNINMGDPRLIRTPFLFQRVNNYMDKMVMQHPDSISAGVDHVLESVKPSEETFKFFLIHFINKYAGSKIVGQDAVYVHIAENYYGKGLAPWTEEEQLKKILDNASKLKPLLIGKVAPDIKMYRKDNSEIMLHDFKSKYTVLYFWDPECGHCKKGTPDMVKFYETYKDKGVEVFAVCTKMWKRDDDGNITLEEVDKCWEYIDEHGMGIWLNTVDPYHRSRYKSIYDMKSTPQIYVLDENKEIISKRLGAEQLSEVMDRIIEMDQKKEEEESGSK